MKDIIETLLIVFIFFFLVLGVPVIGFVYGLNEALYAVGATFVMYYLACKIQDRF